MPCPLLPSWRSAYRNLAVEDKIVGCAWRTNRIPSIDRCDQDNLEHHRRCEDAWVEQHNTAFVHFSHNNLEDDIPPEGGSIFGQIP
jgi:hypothetical protein